MDHPRPGLKFVAASGLDRTKRSFEGFTVEDPADEKLGTLEGFILDIDRALPYYVVVNAGHWFHTKHVLIPIGHFALDSDSKRLITDLPRDRVKRFPGFDLDLFPKLTKKDLDRMADEIALVCCPDLVGEPGTEVSRLEVWAHYETPAWWEPSDQNEPQQTGDRSKTRSDSTR